MKKLICAAACAVAVAALAPAGASAIPGTGEASRLVAVGPSGNSLTCATTVTGAKGRTVEAIPIDRLRELVGGSARKPPR